MPEKSSRMEATAGLSNRFLRTRLMKTRPLLFNLLRYYDWIALTAIVAFLVYVRIRLCTVPLERDEGEYAYMGQMLLQGIMPFREAFNMKLPGRA